MQLTTAGSSCCLALLAILLPAEGTAAGSLQGTPGESAEAVKAAEVGARTWLALVDKGQYGASWDEASTNFKISVTKDAWEKALREVRAPFDPMGARERLLAEFRTELPNSPPGRYVVFQYRTAAAGGKRALETVIMVADGERGWRLAGAFIRPDQ